MRLLLWICLEVQLAACPRGTGSDLWYTSQVSVVHPEGHLTSQSRLCLQFHTWPTANRCNSSFCLFVCLFVLFKHVFYCFPKSTLGGITIKSNCQISNFQLKSKLHGEFSSLLFWFVIGKNPINPTKWFFMGKQPAAVIKHSYQGKMSTLQLEKQTCRG